MITDRSDTDEAELRVRRILVVDDSEELRVVLAILIGAAPDFELVGEAENGRTGIAKAVETRPDVILLDLSMPDMDGLEALPHLRRTVPEARVIVLSGYQRDVMGQRAMEAGALGYIEKGTPPAQLLATLRTMIGDEPG